MTLRKSLAVTENAHFREMPVSSRAERYPARGLMVPSAAHAPSDAFFMVTFKIPLNPLSLLFDLRQHSRPPEQGRSGPKRHPAVGGDPAAIEGGSDLLARDHWQVEGHRDILGMGVRYSSVVSFPIRKKHAAHSWYGGRPDRVHQ